MLEINTCNHTDTSILDLCMHVCDDFCDNSDMVFHVCA